jgi:hypothetical protein
MPIVTSTTAKLKSLKNHTVDILAILFVNYLQKLALLSSTYLQPHIMKQNLMCT